MLGFLRSWDDWSVQNIAYLSVREKAWKAVFASTV